MKGLKTLGFLIHVTCSNFEMRPKSVWVAGVYAASAFASTQANCFTPRRQTGKENSSG
jgi:hypothetical protein